MKYIRIIILLVWHTLISCHQYSVPQSNISNQESIDLRGEPMLLGKSTKTRLQHEPFAGWFNKNYTDYKVDSAVADQLRTKLRNKQFMIFMGTWCGDSRQEVPKIYRLLDYCGIPDSNIQLINLNIYDSLYKQSPGHEEKGLGIHRVPDLLVYENKTEIGRIIEKPVISWEKDLLAIAEGQKYYPRYKTVIYLQLLFQSLTLEKIEKDIERIADSLKPLVTKNEGLQSFGTVLMASKEISKAIVVLRLNTMLYPDNVHAFLALGDVYLKNGDHLKAKQNYQQALMTQPGNEKAATMLALLMKRFKV